MSIHVDKLEQWDELNSIMAKYKEKFGHDYPVGWFAQEASDIISDISHCIDTNTPIAQDILECIEKALERGVIVG
jgi:hypothetical protein